MGYKHCHIINTDGYPVEFILVIDGEIQHYTLKEGETLVDSLLVLEGLVKPRWNGLEWIEGATAEEIAMTLPALEDIKSARIAEILSLSADKVSSVEVGYSLGEVKTFEQQYQGAVDLFAGNTSTAAAQFIITLAAKRSEVGGVGMTADMLAQRIIANYTAAKEYTVNILGIQQGLTTRVGLATTAEEVTAIVWPE